jgi:hypothetical protein
LGHSRPTERWAAGHELDRLKVLEATYSWTRTVVVRAVTAKA